MALRVPRLTVHVMAALLVVAAPASASTIVINEFVANHDGTDNAEFIEVFGLASTDYSSLTILQIEGDGSVSGQIDSVLDVGMTDASGFWTTPFMSNELENGTITLLLVSGFTGFLTQDLDTDNDGVLDTIPWSAIVDGIAVTDGGLTDLNYGGVPVLIPGFDGNAFTVGGASRIPNGTDTDSVNDWVRNIFGGTSTSGTALNTPNDVNAVVPEPATLLLVGSGAAAALARRRRGSPRRPV